MPPDRRKYLWDALAAAELLFEFGAGKSFEDYRADALRSGVERQFEIVGEALNQLSKVDPGARRHGFRICHGLWPSATS